MLLTLELGVLGIILQSYNLAEHDIAILGEI
jgi:hypothetical protein